MYVIIECTEDDIINTVYTDINVASEKFDKIASEIDEDERDTVNIVLGKITEGQPYGNNREWFGIEIIIDSDDGYYGSYNLTWDKFDKFMPEDGDIQDEFEELKKAEDIEEFINLHANEERMHQFFPRNGTVKELAKHIASKI